MTDLYRHCLCLVVFLVLRRIRQLEKKLMITDSRLSPVREILSRFFSKLSDIQGFLQEAATTAQQTVDQNRANSLKFQRNEVIFYYPHRLSATLQDLILLL